ncbi:MAG: TetR/AcrR family transcriptional regulator [Solirubrobacteraceae bacterium]
MPERPTRPALQERYDRRRQAMIASAAEAFAKRGYDQTTMQDLAASMGLATGAVYHYFDGKEKLLLAICDDLMEPLLARVREINDSSPVDRLRALIRVWVAHVVEYSDHMLVFQQERHVIERDTQWRGVRESRKAFERIVRDALLEALPDGEGTRDRRIELGALLGMVNHTALWCRPGGRLTTEEIADGYLGLILGPL